jgi:hypothetical protein
VVFSATIEADDGDADITVGSGDLGPGTGGERGGRTDDGGIAQKSATSEVIDEEGHGGEGLKVGRNLVRLFGV